jgi:hypothetical protein
MMASMSVILIDSTIKKTIFSLMKISEILQFLSVHEILLMLMKDQLHHQYMD